MFLGHLQVLFYARPPNYQLLFSKPRNGFWQAHNASGLCQIEKLKKTKKFLEFDFSGGLFYKKAISSVQLEISKFFSEFEFLLWDIVIYSKVSKR